MASVAVLQTKEKVQRFLTDLVERVGIDSDGDFHFRHGSAHIFVRVSEWHDEETLVRVWAPTNIGIPPTPELFKYLALEGSNYLFGRLDAIEEEGKVNVYFAHMLLGTYLDPEELKSVAAVVAKTADEIDDKIKNLFGGRVFHEE